MLLKVWRLAEITGVSRLRVEKEAASEEEQGALFEAEEGDVSAGQSDQAVWVVRRSCKMWTDG